MPNSAIRRLENFCMPPKKFAWRFEHVSPPKSSTTSIQESPNSAPVNEENNKMGLMIDDKMKPNPPSDETCFPEKHEEDAPLDFSVKNHTRVSSNGLPNSDDKPAREDVLKYPFNSLSEHFNRLNNMQSAAFPGMSDDKKSSPFSGPGIWHPNGISWNDPWVKQSLNENRNSSKMKEFLLANGLPTEYHSDIPTKCHSPVNVKPEANGGSPLCEKSPERQSSSRESSPVNGESILQGMLKSQNHGRSVNKISSEMQNVNISKSPESLQVANCVSPIMAPASQPIIPSLVHPMNNLVPLHNYFPFFGGMGYVRPTVGSLSGGGILSHSTDATVLQALARRTRRKKADDRPFKAFAIDALEEKLQSASTRSFAFGLDYKKQAICNGQTPKSPPSDADRRSPMNESAEHANGDLQKITPNSSIETNGVVDNPCNSRGSCDSNDSPQEHSLARAETAEATSCTNIRKRKSTNDMEKDEAYWDRRRKNNLAAKRSREARRRKEDAIANMAMIYENQNMELQQSVTNLTFQLNETSAHLNRLMREHESLTIQNNILQERLSQKRCGHCGAQLPSIN